MKRFLFLLLMSFPINANAQIKKCELGKLTFNVNNRGFRDTLGNLVFQRNGNDFILNKKHIVFTNLNVRKLKNFQIEGAEICQFQNDTTLILIPTSKTIIFKYKHNGNILTKEFNVSLLPKPEIKVQLDNRIQEPLKPVVKYKSIDSLSFDLNPSGYEKWMVQEEFIFTIVKLDVYLVRERKAYASLHFKNGRSFYIGDLLKKALPGDRLSIEYQPEWLLENGKTERMMCGEMVNYTLGSPK